MPITLFFSHWGLGLDMGGAAGIMQPLAGQLQSYFMRDGKDGFCWTTGCLYLLALVSSLQIGYNNLIGILQS